MRFGSSREEKSLISLRGKNYTQEIKYERVLSDSERNLDSYSGRLKTALEKTITLKLLIQFKQKLYQWKERSKIYGVAI